MKHFLFAIVVLIASRCGAADLPAFEQAIALPRLTLSQQTPAQIRLSLREEIPQEVTRHAEAEFLRRFGGCGTVQFAGRDGDAWTFSTNVGYGGAPGPKITVLFRSSRSEGPKPNETRPPRVFVTPRS